jgi:hypothetical protein
MPSYANVITGWKGALHSQAIQDELTTGYIRFRSESLNIPLGVEVDTEIHVGQRTPTIYNYSLIKPEGSIEVPLLVDASSLPQVKLSPEIIWLFKAMVNIDGQTPPSLGKTTIYRGDVTKEFDDAWMQSFSISGSADQPMDVSINLRALGGSIKEDNTLPTVVWPKTRGIHFNELLWGALPGITGVQGSSVVPRNFSLNITNNLVEDASYNPVNIRSLRGFGEGSLEITGSIDIVGPAILTNSGVNGVQSIPWDNGTYNFGGFYTFSTGIWRARTLNVPGVTEIAITTLEFTIMYDPSQQNSKFINYGPLIT